MNELDENEINQTDTTGNEEVLVEEGDDFGSDFINASIFSDFTLENNDDTISGTIEQPYDKDIFKIRLIGEVSYWIYCYDYQTDSGAKLPDPELSIFDHQFNKIEFVDSNPSETQTQTTFTPSSTGEYYFKINSRSSNTGSYVLMSDPYTRGLPSGGLGITDTLTQDDSTQVFSIFTTNTLKTISFRSDLLASAPEKLTNYSLQLYDIAGNPISGDWVNVDIGVVNFNISADEPSFWFLLEVKALNKNAYGTYTVERLIPDQISLPPIPLNFTGTPTDETLAGNAANNYLDGMGGLDTLLGKAGNDIIESYSSAETIDGGEGNNTVSYQYATSRVNVNLSLSGSQNAQGGGMDTLISIANINGSPFNDILTGDQSINSIQGLAGNDTINGGLGGDQLDGGEGQDTLSYAKSKAGVTVNLTTNEMSGGDATGDIILDFEHVLGSNAKDSITGNLMANRLSGGNGYDTLNGSDGNDTLFGGAGRDILMGGNDKDALNGGASADRFVFKTLDDSVVGFSRDVITDFRPAQKDIIDVSAIDAIPGTGNNAFDFIGSNAFTKASGEIRYVVAGNQTLVQFDYDCDARADMEIALTGNIALAATDFYL